MPDSSDASRPRAHPIVLAVALSLGAAISLGITRFAYALLLPVMRDDLAWSYTLAGAMNTVNAAGYLAGALMTPLLMRRLGTAAVLLWGSALASVFMALSGFFIEAHPLLLQRFLAGVASAYVFISGGLLAARIGSRVPRQAGLVLGIYYGGVGTGPRWPFRCCSRPRAARRMAGAGPGGGWRCCACWPRWCCSGPRACSPKESCPRRRDK